MAIRWVSNPNSIKANQPSVLGIAETLAAMGVSVWIAITWDTYLHIAIGASIAPLLLMRTDESCIQCYAIAKKLRERLSLKIDKALERRGGIWQLIVVIALILLFLLWFATLLLLARIAAWITTAVRHPFVAIIAIPGNWRYATIVLDSKKWPDLLPAPRAELESFDGFGDVGDWLKRIFFRVSDDRDPYAIFPMFLSLLTIVYSPLIVIPAFVYRWSLKSTAIIWFPLLWAMHSVREAGKPLRTYFDIYLRDPITKIVLWVSIAVIISFIAKIVLFNVQADFVDWWNRTPLLRFFSLYVAPAEIQWWQAAMVVNSAIAIVMYILALRWSIRIEHDELTNEAMPRRVFQMGLFIRPILSCYTIFCTLYITIRAASDWALPELGSKPFPWM